MLVTIEERRQTLFAMRDQHHSTCPVCGDRNPNGLRVTFDVCADGAVEAEVVCGEDKEGYAAHLHGGVIATLLDGAMTNCLFSHGIRAVTGELKVKMLQPVQAEVPVVLRAWLERRLSLFYGMKSELLQRGQLAARGSAKFMHKPMEEGQC